MPLLDHPQISTHFVRPDNLPADQKCITMPLLDRPQISTMFLQHWTFCPMADAVKKILSIRLWLRALCERSE